MQAVFLLAYTDLRREDRTGPSPCTARSLRRVGADVAVVLNCTPSSARRLRREARYDQLATYSAEVTGTTIDVAVLADCALVVRDGPTPGSVLCDLTVDGKDTSVTTLDRPAVELYRVLVRLDEARPLVLIGNTNEDLDDPRTVAEVVRAGFVDTHDVRSSNEPDREPRTSGILVRGLRSYGDGRYLDPDGCFVHWARLGH